MASSRIDAISRLSEWEMKSEAQRLAQSSKSNISSSWHDHYQHSAYIYIGGLDYRLSEGDVAIMFSQWGEPIDVHLARDKKTGSSKGFCFLAYEDQRSTVLAVDNANGMGVMGRRIRVDHVEKYRAPIKFSETREVDEEGHLKQVPYRATGAEGRGIFNADGTAGRTTESATKAMPKSESEGSSSLPIDFIETERKPYRGAEKVKTRHKHKHKHHKDRHEHKHHKDRHEH